MKIAVIGGGLFGCTAAIYAARAGHEVHLFEKNSDIMQGASTHNQFRLHRGYHYPRSAETGQQCRTGNLSFEREYGNAVITPDKRKHGDQIYAIARNGSKTSYEEFLRFCEVHGMPHRSVETREPLLDPETIQMAVAVLESAVDPDRLAAEVGQKLDEAGVVLFTHVTADGEYLRKTYDKIIIATYAGTNSVARDLGIELKALQFEVVEKPVIRLPKIHKNTSIVIMDGEFCCVDPYGQTGLHLQGHVKHAIWARSVGTEPVIPTELQDYINKGVIENPEHSKADIMLEDAARFMPFLKDAEHVGSLFTVRAVLPNVHDTDERPTLVDVLDDQVIRIFSGKLGTAVDAAQEALFAMQRSKQRLSA